METAHHSIVEPLLGVLTSLHPDVQREGNQGNGSHPVSCAEYHWALRVSGSSEADLWAQALWCEADAAQQAADAAETC